LKAPSRISGIALHTGVRAHLTLRPAPAGAGIVVRRVDLPGQPEIPAHASRVIDVQRATTIAVGDAKVHTVEHVLAALYGCGVDNAVIEMDSAEPPVVDGSSAPFVALIEAAGIVVQDLPRRIYRVPRPVMVEAGGTTLVIWPDDQYRISCTVQYGVNSMDTQYATVTMGDGVFARELSAARTFCRYDEIEPLMIAGLIRGGSLDNAVILKDDAIICKDGLRFPDEQVRHKMLDIVGDLSLVGCRLLGHVIAIRPGHPTNVALAQAILATMEEPVAV